MAIKRYIFFKRNITLVIPGQGSKRGPGSGSGGIGILVREKLIRGGKAHNEIFSSKIQIKTTFKSFGKPEGIQKMTIKKSDRQITMFNIYGEQNRGQRFKVNQKEFWKATFARVRKSAAED